ncbi:MAG: DUF2868 domain-containing protein [Marinobacterium sp.]|nr:DUF2868 domain-containing protein [Marinobacterium sp.]
MINKSYTHLSWGIAVVAAIAGVFSTVAATTGDAAGRVNLMYLVLLYVVLPLFSLLLLALFSALKKPPLLVGALACSSLWPRSWRDALPELKREQRFQPWLFCQSQKAILAFNLGCLVSFITLLLFNDLSFVWRSTLLTADDIYPFLTVIAAPWWFVDSAQPALELLVTTRDSRLATNPTAGADYGLWWQFLLAAQLCYGILPRLLLLWLANHRFKALPAQPIEAVIPVTAPLLNQPPATPVLAEVAQFENLQQQAHAQQEHTQQEHTANATTAAEPYCLVIWADLPQNLVDEVTAQIGTPAQTFHAGPHGQMDQEMAAEADPRRQLVLVAAWEPPLGELDDFLQQGHGALMPLDWRENAFTQASALHLDEWRRFCHSLEQWQFLQLDNANLDEESK